MWNYKLIWRIFKILVAISVFLFVLNSCDDSNPVVNEYRIGDNTTEETPVPCCVTPEDVNLMMANEQEDNDLPPKIVYTSRAHGWSTTKLKDLITIQTLKQNPNIENQHLHKDDKNS